MHSKRVIVHGNSLFMAAVQSSLAGVNGLDVEGIKISDGELVEQVRAAAPDVIVFELGVTPDQIAFTLLKEFPGVELIGLEPESHRLLVLSVREETEPDTADLVRMIQEKGVAAQQG